VAWADPSDEAVVAGGDEVVVVLEVVLEVVVEEVVVVAEAVGAGTVVGAMVVVVVRVVVATGVVPGLVEPLPQAASGPARATRRRHVIPGRRRTVICAPDPPVPTGNVYCVGASRATVAG
jgi:hypothetical protein